MANDVLRYADHNSIDQLTLLGHNIGSKVAMTLSCMYPDRVAALISLDTAPVSFSHDVKAIKATIDHLTQIRNLNITGKTRKAAIDVIKESFPDVGIANFIASNVVYDELTNSKTVKWGVNFDSIIDNFHHIKGFNDDGTLKPYPGPSLFINGSYSTKQLQEAGAFPEEDL